MVCQGEVIFLMFKEVTEIIVPALLLVRLLSIQSATSKQLQSSQLHGFDAPIQAVIQHQNVRNQVFMLTICRD